MANVWFSVVVLIVIQNVFANENCPDPSKITSNCDLCLQCGNTWCSEPLNSDHCRVGEPDNWCSAPERPKQFYEKRKGISSGLVDSLLFLEKPHKQSFTYNSPVEKNVTHFFRNSTRNWEYVDVIIDSAKCDGSKCEVGVEVAVSSGFCDRKSATNELVDLTIQVEDIKKVSWKLHVPCACECSKVVEERAPACKGNGDLSCGLCSCYEGWTGPYCNVTNCEKSRADISCENDRSDKGQCSGNGYCGPCETCVCYTNMTGWQYFDRNNFCSDICMDTIGCEHCLTNGTYGLCDPLPNEAECTHYNMKMLKFDEQVANRLDGLDRPEWVKCNSTFKDPDRNVEYFAKKSEAGVSIMVVKPNNIAEKTTLTPTGSKVPLILGVLGVLAAVAAVGGVLLWKHLHAVPPMPFSSPDYQNIDAEDCVGENPLYKSPTSTFTNPQFGKC